MARSPCTPVSEAGVLGLGAALPRGRFRPARTLWTARTIFFMCHYKVQTSAQCGTDLVGR